MPASSTTAALRARELAHARHAVSASSIRRALQGGAGRGERIFCPRRRSLHGRGSVVAAAAAKPFSALRGTTYTTATQLRMASTATTLVKKEPPLSFMQHLSSSVSYYCPPDALAPNSNKTNENTNERRHPELILVLSWMGARDTHIAKYIAQHRALFPSSRILLIRSPASHVFWPSLARRHIPPAIRILKDFAEPEPTASTTAISGRPRVLLHILSNGGVSTAARIRELLRKELGTDAAGNKLVIPRYALCLDSCPGNFEWRSTHRALLQSLPRWSSPMVHLVIAIAWVIYKLRLTRPAQNLNAEALRRASLLRRETQRTYLYGTADAVISWRHVENHARRAEEAGFKVRRERFEGGEHVSLVRKESQRYWQAVKETWDEAEVESEKAS
ncbi:hypothetical protein TARUN_2362 [Trichoderma arundinaceum]|uniref:Indole-diterpene biosynthesis n=1 Tax=Trichoderma arundinaceum TaxID=490622 RepID=A0A395NV57_TRIAR|nr:hypothetical protein TARUN_2362 [Trichoderma arundinaceum]